MTKPFVDLNQLSVVGLVQEQHAQRTRLYKQWKQIEWPIAQDALNLLGVKVVPLLIAIDENGVVRSHRANSRFLVGWMDGKPIPGKSMASSDEPELLTSARDHLFAIRNTDVDAAITDYQLHIKSTGDDAHASDYFELAVAQRVRYDQSGDPADFQAAIDNWAKALSMDPNHYIYRRRIQQYGARLGKPYPFYDWVETAQQEIANRGETPVQLVAPLSGAEIARPSRRLETVATRDESPDPQGKILRDKDRLISTDIIVVPRRVQPGNAARVHLLLRPSDRAKWNNEAEPTLVWINTPAGVSVSQQFHSNSLPSEIESTELRRFEVEIQVPENATSIVKVPGYALFYVCRCDNSQCLYLRKDFEIEVEVDRD